ncbi:MAG: hypothetical protein QGH13_03440 [Candidatus Thalassarchaeaceae archaeon]|jgi:SepF-like predicted cell division protein (DUF552 family)|nr:hypothetical protein [Candidatus Thalassarchaeaceae archaeon]
MAGAGEPRWLPISNEPRAPQAREGEAFHFLDARFPDAPIARTPNGIILHRAEILDITGLPQLLDWASDGDIVMLDTRRLMGRQTEFNAVIERLAAFVERDLGGELVQMGETRILILPPSVRATEKIDRSG